MTQIKSEKALNYLESNEYTVSHKYGDEVPCIDPNDAKQAIIIAETEAEERHAKELQELKEMAIEAVNTALCYYGCSKGEYCQEPCERRDLIIQKLTKK